MKSFLSALLAVALSIQLCGASIDITTDKRYPIIDAFLTKAKTFSSMQFLMPAELFRNAWPQFIEDVANNPDFGHYKTEDFQGFTEAMQQFLDVAKQLDGDKTNCDLLYMAEQRLNKLQKFECAKTFDKLYNLKADLEEKYKELTAPVLTDTMSVLAEAIESFQITLNDKERQEYSDFLILCEKFLKTQDEVEKVFRYQQIMRSLPLDDVQDVSDNCKSQPHLFIFFLMTLESSSEKFMTPELYKQLQDEKEI